MELEVVVALASAIFAGIALVYSGYQTYSDKKTRQLVLLETVYHDIQNLEQRFYDNFQNKTSQERETWYYQFFNQLEWFSFLVNEKKIDDEKLINYFKPSIIEWYEKIFLIQIKKEVIDDPSQFSEFKILYKQFKNSN